ncbi:MAG: patatin-like phospholipase family protein [Bacillota bacterium]
MLIRFRNLKSRMGEMADQVKCLPGDRIVIQGRKNPHFYLVKSGRIEVFHEDGGKILLARLSPGEYFGEVSCLTGEVSSATYAVAGSAELLKTDREGLLKLMSELPEFNRHVVETLCSMVKNEGADRGQFHFPVQDGTGESRREKETGPAGRPLVGLALGAGVVRGVAHIGVIRSLKKNGIPVDLIAGTSAGALVGACLAAGVPLDKIEEFARGLRWSRVAAPVIPPGRAFFNNEKLAVLLDKIIGEKTFSELEIPLAVVAADACTGEEVVIREGKVSDAVRASSAIPAIFEPVSLFGRTLIDGGTVNMVPASVCRSMGADIVIAVSVSDFSFQSGPPRNIIMAILRYTDMMLKKQVTQSKNQWADVVVSVERPDLSGYNFREARQFIREGQSAADSVIPMIKSLMAAWRG